MGRRKIEIKKVQDTNTRQVTFSKRRTGLFKKANELSILCGAEVAIVVFSPGNKPYSFGHPNVDVVAAKFLQQELKSSKGDQAGSSSSDAKLDKLNQELASVMDQFRKAVKKTKVQDKVLIGYDKTQREELQELLDSLSVLKYKIKERLDELEASEAMLMLQEQSVEFNENHVAKRKRGRKNLIP